MRLFIYHNPKTCFNHVSDDGKTTGCCVSVKSMQFISREELTPDDLQKRINCKVCRDYFAPKFFEKKETPNKAKKLKILSDIQEGNCMLSGNVLKTYLGGEETVNIPESVEIINDSAFARCQELTSVDIPDGVTEIRDYAFAVCTGLKEITLPQNVKLGKNVFYQCSELTVIKIRFPGDIIGTFGKEALDAMFQKL